MVHKAPVLMELMVFVSLVNSNICVCGQRMLDPVSYEYTEWIRMSDRAYKHGEPERRG